MNEQYPDPYEPECSDRDRLRGIIYWSYRFGIAYSRQELRTKGEKR